MPQKNPISREEIIRRVRKIGSGRVKFPAAFMYKRDSAAYKAALRVFGSWRATVKAAGFDPDLCGLNRIWTRETILERIRFLASRHAHLGAKATKCIDYGLYCAARSAFGTWENVLRSAGLDPGKHILKRHWNPERIKAALEKIVKERGRLTWVDLHRDDRGLLEGIGHRFGTLEKAAKAFGLPCEYKRALVTREETAQRILQRNREGKSLSNKAIFHEDRALHSAVRRQFGSWGRALVAIGLAMEFKQHRCSPWNRERILSELKAWAGAHGPVSARRLKATGESRLYQAASRHFGSLEEAALRGGVPFDPHYTRWSLDCMLREIRAFRKKTGSVYRKRVLKENPRLVEAVGRFGLTWEEAVESAGYSYDRYRRARRWTPERIEYELRSWAAKHGGIVQREVSRADPVFVQCVVKRYGSLGKAAAAFRLPYQQTFRTWNAQDVVRRILERVRQGKPINVASVQKEEAILVQAANRYHGNWKAAVRKAGINYDLHRKSPKWDAGKVEKELRRWVDAHGGKLDLPAFRTGNVALYMAVKKHLGGSLIEVANRLGIRFDSPARKWNKEEVIRALAKVSSSTPDLTHSKLRKMDSCLFAACCTHFGSYSLAMVAMRARAGKSGWPEEIGALLGRYADEKLADALGLPVEAVARKRKALGIPLRRSAQRRVAWTGAMLREIRTHHPADFAEKHGLSRHVVMCKRKKLGLPKPPRKPDPKKKCWTEAQRSLLGTQPDRVLARAWKMCKATVTRERQRLRIPSWKVKQVGFPSSP